MIELFKRFTLSYALLILILVAAYLRLYNLRGSLHFQGDQGRDALIVSQIFTQKDLVFIGPVTSVGNMYLGPLYYYFMLPFLWLTYPSPIGPAYSVALLSIATVWLMYRLGKKLIGKRAAFIAAFLMTLSSTVINFARFSWNPNPAPFVACLMIYFTYTAWRKDVRHWMWVAMSFAVLMQLHYLTLLTAGGAGLIWLWSLKENLAQGSNKKQLKEQLKYSLVGLLILILSFTPLVLFDSKHDQLNIKAFRGLILQEENFKLATNNNLGGKLWLTLKETHGRGMHILFEITLGKERLLNTTLLVCAAAIFIQLLTRKTKHQPGQLVLASYLLTGVIGTAFYEHTIFDHYIAYLFPLTFWVLGLCLAWLSRRVWGYVIMLGFVGYFLWLNLGRLPLQDVSWTIDDIQAVAATINERVQRGEKYNLVLFAESGDLYGQNYRYFLSTTHNPPLSPENSDQAEKLFIINETEQEIDVESNPVREIQIFPNKNIVETYVAHDGPTVIVLSR